MRRAGLFRATALLAPRPMRAAPAPPLIVAGALRTATGLGRSARLSLAALRAAGAEVAALDLTAALRQSSDLPLDPAVGEAVEGAGTLVVHVNAPLMGLALLGVGRRRARGKRIVGYWAWELPEVPAEWRLGIPLVDEIWVPSAFTAAAIAPIAEGRPVHVVPHPVAVEPAPTRAGRTPGAPFTVLCMLDASSSLARKNPQGVIAAFRLAFGDDPGVRLVLKTQRLRDLPEARAQLAALADRPNMELRDATLDERGIDALYAEADVLLSLHRAEGFGLTLAEAMRRGLPVVATGWSGNADFLTEAVGVPVPWRLVPAEDPQRTYHHPGLRWAEADVEAAAAALRSLRDDPDRRARLGAAAADYAATHWTPAAYVARLREIGVPA
ncbi:glycosyltransferase [Falsiroseomonas bella]|nr:glycosyltransferase [Falsiroseomonas bella]